MLTPLALLTLGCASGPDPTAGEFVAGEAFQLSITPIYVASQAEMIDEAKEIEIRVLDGDGNETPFALYQGEDKTFENTEIRALADAKILLVGRDDDDIIFHGRSEPLSISSGAARIYIFIARDGAPLSLPELDTPSAMGSLHALGDGRFLSVGGTQEGSRPESLTSAVTEFDMGVLGIGEETRGLSSSIHATTSAGWVGHTSTVLPDGRILVVGGARGLSDETGGLVGQSTATSSVSLLDPSADLNTAGTPLNHGRLAHRATLGPDDIVVVTGGFAARDSGNSVASFAELYDPLEDSWTVATGSLYTAGIFHAQARLGDTGVLVCGGLDAALVPSSECQVILPTASIESAPDLSQPLLHAELTDLGEGRVLLTGGLVAPSTGEPLSLTSDLSATTAAWILDDTGWQPVGPMRIPRALHSTQRTPDGRVVIAGGVSRIDASSERFGQAYGGLLYDAADAVPCVEIFDPVGDTFTLLTNCEPSSASGTLPSPVAMPAIAHDSTFGTLITGGLAPDPRQSAAHRTLLYPSFSARQ